MLLPHRCTVWYSLMLITATIFVGVPHFRIRQLQLVLNYAAYLLANLSRFASISDIHVWHNLYWLPIADRIRYKILKTVWFSLTGTAPKYSSELWVPVSTQPGRRMLRSAMRNDLVVPCSHRNTCTSGLLSLDHRYGTTIQINRLQCIYSNIRDTPFSIWLITAYSAPLRHS